MTATSATTTATTTTTSTTNGYRKLSYDQVSRLEEIVGTDYIVEPIGDFPKVPIKAQDLIVALKKKLEEDGFKPEDIRINGSAASVVIGGSKCRAYNDLDILFNFVPDQKPSIYTSYDRTRHDKMRLCVLKCLESILPEESKLQSTNYERLAEAYFQKYVFVQNNKNDLWSLVALRNVGGRSIELKFVDSMKRKYEFSIDSFQLIISEYLTFRETSGHSMSPKFFPTVYAESVYGDYEAAVSHLEMQLIATRNPEEIRGGGLLKYCYLKTCGYRDADVDSMIQLNKYMCSRFFIDFPDVPRQQNQLEKYLVNHFVNRGELKRPFLMYVLTAVQQHALCLPMRERSRTLDMIHAMACRYMCPHNAYPSAIYCGTVYGGSQQHHYLQHRDHIDSAPYTMANHVYHRSGGRAPHHYDPQHQCLTLRHLYFATPIVTQTATIS